MKNTKGFTLIELLATLVILSIIMLVAVPSTISVLDKNKKDTFITDAKRLVALAESEIRNNEKLDVAYNGVIVFPFSELDDGSFEKDPDSSSYNTRTSFVVAHKKGNVNDYQFVYYVQMYGEKRGISFNNANSLDRNLVISAASTSLDVSSASSVKSFLSGKIIGYNSSSNETIIYSNN